MATVSGELQKGLSHTCTCIHSPLNSPRKEIPSNLRVFEICQVQWVSNDNFGFLLFKHIWKKQLNCFQIELYSNSLIREKKMGNIHETCVRLFCHSDSLRPHGLWATRLLCPWDSLGKNTGVGYHFLLQGIFPSEGLNQGLLHCRRMLYHLSF